MAQDSSNRVRCQCVGECSGDPNSPECRHITVMVDAIPNRGAICTCCAAEGLVGWFTDPECPLHGKNAIPNSAANADRNARLDEKRRMPPAHATRNRVAWVAFDDDLSHGIQLIIGVFSTEAAAKAAAEREANHSPGWGRWEIQDA